MGDGANWKTVAYLSVLTNKIMEPGRLEQFLQEWSLWVVSIEWGVENQTVYIDAAAMERALGWQGSGGQAQPLTICETPGKSLPALHHSALFLPFFLICCKKKKS